VNSKPEGYPDEFEELDFDIVEEGWNVYELSDGVTIKCRNFLKKIIVDPNEPNKFAFDIAPIISSVFAPLVNRGEKNNPPTPQEYETLPGYEIKINTSNEPFNVYRILKNGKIVRLKLVVTKVTRIVDRFDNEGLPFYILNHGPVIHIDKDQTMKGGDA